MFDRSTRAQVELFRPENVPLETEEARLSQQYQKLIGSLTVPFRGEERTLAQMGRYLEEPDRAVAPGGLGIDGQPPFAGGGANRGPFSSNCSSCANKSPPTPAFPIICNTPSRRGAGSITRRRIACNFTRRLRRKSCPALRRLQARAARATGPGSAAPLGPGGGSLEPAALAAVREGRRPGGRRAGDFHSDWMSRLAGDFRLMREMRLLDLDNRKGKAPGGYQSTLSESRLPFIFMNAVGIQRDVETILHEAGHAFHALAAREEDLYRLPQRAALSSAKSPP